MEPENTNVEKTPQETVTQTEPDIDYAALMKGVDIEAVNAAGGMAKYIQSQADSRVTKAVQTARMKWEAEQTAAQDEATRLAKMTENERIKYQLEKDRRALEEEKAQFNRERLMVETAKQMVAGGLPDLSAFVTGKDADTTKNNLEAVSGILSAWKQEQINGAMRGTPPKDVNVQGKTPLTREQIKRMSREEINQAWNDGLIDTAALTS